MFVARLTLCCALPVLPLVAPAQETASDSLPFRAHQWAAQFAGGTSFASLGFLRFTSPSRAWLLDLHFTGGHSHHYAYASDTVVQQSFTSAATVDARIGRRFYQGHGKAVVSFLTAGALGGFSHSCYESTQPSGGGCSNGWTAGVFAEVGGAYLITRRLSIGGAATMTFAYRRITSKAADGSLAAKEWEYQGSLQGLSFAATVYF